MPSRRTIAAARVAETALLFGKEAAASHADGEAAPKRVKPPGIRPRQLYGPLHRHATRVISTPSVSSERPLCHRRAFRGTGASPVAQVRLPRHRCAFRGTGAPPVPPARSPGAFAAGASPFTSAPRTLSVRRGRCRAYPLRPRAARSDAATKFLCRRRAR